MRGRPPIPTQTLQLRGSWRAKKRAHEPERIKRRPLPPKWLDAAGRAEFVRMVRNLEAMDLVSCSDRGTLAIMANAWSTMIRANKAARAADDTSEARTQWGIASDASKIYIRAASEFGMTPAARARVAGQRDEGEGLDALLASKPDL